jgi:hypothetical protein
VIRFLRLFRAFRDTEAEVGWQKAEVALWRTRCESAEARVRELTDKMLDDRAKLADAMSLRAIGKRVFTKADPVPAEQATTSRVVHGRQFARVAAQQQTAEFFKDLQKQMNPPSAS